MLVFGYFLARKGNQNSKKSNDYGQNLCSLISIIFDFPALNN